MSTTSNYPTVFVDGQKLQYFAKSHILSQWNNDFVSSSAPLSNILSNCTNLITTSNSCIGIMTSNPQQTLDIVGNIKASGTIFVSDLNIGGVSAGGGGGIVTYSAILPVMSNMPFMIPSGAVLYQFSSNTLQNKAVSYVVVNSITKTGVSGNNGLFSINCTAFGNSSTYNWTLSSPSTTLVGGSNFTFTNVPYSTGTTSFNVTASTGLSGAGSFATSINYSVTSDALPTPLFSIGNPSFAAVSTTTVDSLVYYTGSTTYRFLGGSLSFSNLVAPNNSTYTGYTGNNFLQINNAGYQFSRVFATSPTSSNLITSTITVPSIGSNLTSNISFTVSNLALSTSCNINIAYLNNAVATLSTIPFTNLYISSVSRTYENGTTLGSRDVLYLPITNQFTSSHTFGLSNFVYSTQTATGNRTRLYINITPYTDVPLNSFIVNHNSAISDIQVQWTTIGSTYYSANTSYLSTGCGSGTQSGGSWYIQRPNTISRTAYSTILLYIVYNTSSANIYPVPSIG